MTKQQLWKIYTDRNPSFDGNGTVTLSAAGLRKMFNQTWDIAFERGEYESDEDFSPPSHAAGGSNSLDMLKQMFNI